MSLEESLDVAQIATLPAIVFRCIQYLEAKKAELEEGIYRLSGSSAVIKSLKDRFNAGAAGSCLVAEDQPLTLTNSQRVMWTCSHPMSTGTHTPSPASLRPSFGNFLQAS